MDTQTEQLQLTNEMRADVYNRGIQLANHCLQSLRLGRTERADNYDEAVVHDANVAELIDSIYRQEQMRDPEQPVQMKNLEIALASAFIADKAANAFKEVSAYTFTGMNESNLPDGNRYTVISFAEPRKSAYLQRLRFRVQAHEDRDSAEEVPTRVLQCALIATNQGIEFASPSDINQALERHLSLVPHGIASPGEGRGKTAMEKVLPIWIRDRAYY